MLYQYDLSVVVPVETRLVVSPKAYAFVKFNDLAENLTDETGKYLNRLAGGYVPRYFLMIIFEGTGRPHEEVLREVTGFLSTRELDFGRLAFRMCMYPQNYEKVHFGKDWQADYIKANFRADKGDIMVDLPVPGDPERLPVAQLAVA